MTMKKLYSLLAGLCLLAAAACNDDDLAKYETPECRLNFLYYTTDSTVLGVKNVNDEKRRYSFSFTVSSDEEAKRDTVWFDVETMGFLADEVRWVRLQQIPVEGVKNAEPGVHYVAFNDKEMEGMARIEPGKSRGKIPVILLRAGELKDTTVVLKFGFKENEYFVPGYEGLDTRTIEITDRLSEPSSWYKRYGAQPEHNYKGRCIANLIGHYGREKHQFMRDHTPLEWDNDCIEDIMEGNMDDAYVEYIFAKLRKELKQLNEDLGDDGPLTEKDGTVVSFEEDYGI